MAYEIYIVIRDTDYPMDTPEDPQLWEAGWYGYVGGAGDVDPTTFDDYEDAMARAEELTVLPTVGIERIEAMTDSWDVAARRYLERLGDAEYAAYLTRPGRGVWHISNYHASLIEALNANDEERFKATKMLRGCDSALGI